ncbi:GNAT family N-acetyltransferase [Hymenobacter sp. CRA2]|uniref:GNAT family N-acetyltransferase n=1 Tax=Hymenobacter sp. CRA2 TaxID=1955620 RepID=UPI0009C88452|nr:GNAT family N-acetyltransferase [Hymenobacter sp. CRA2]OON68560.1 hypothetical protein B0919_13045 [Hymenobacter sp. CRA2]
MSLRIRAYAPTDEDAVLQLFRSNLEPYFVPEEEEELRHFLRQQVEVEGLPYFVAEQDGWSGPVAAGGYALNNPHAVLTWGMVERSLHRRGIGKEFTRHRIRECRRAYPDRGIEVKTSQLTEDFYAGLGFRTLSVEPDKFGPGLHQVHMLLEEA